MAGNYNRNQSYGSRGGQGSQSYDTKGDSVQMARHPFNIQDGLIRVQGNQPYLLVAYRIYQFRKEHPDWAMVTSTEFYERPGSFKGDGTPIMASFVRATCEIKMPIYREEMVGADSSKYIERYEVVQSASKEENIAGFSDPLEKAETGAMGRALAAVGYGTIYAGDELAESKPIDAALKHVDDRLQEPEPSRVVDGRVQSEASVVARPARYEGDDRYHHSEFGVCSCKSIVEVRYDEDDVEYGHFDFDGTPHQRTHGLYASGWKREDLPVGATAYKKRNRPPKEDTPSEAVPTEQPHAPQPSVAPADMRTVEQQFASANIDDPFEDEPAGQPQPALDLPPTVDAKPSAAQLAAQRRRKVAK